MLRRASQERFNSLINEFIRHTVCHILQLKVFKRLPLNSHPVGSNGRNNIVAVTPMKFLPIEEFEKHQKSVNANQTQAIMSSMITKIGYKVDVAPLNKTVSKN